MKELTFFDLVAVMRAGQIVRATQAANGKEADWIGGQKCHVNGILREDGSGRRWIIKICAERAGHGEVFWDETRPCPFVME